MTTLMNVIIENEINRGKYSGMPLEAKYNCVRYVTTSGELAVFERAVALVNEAYFAGTEASAMSDAWECLAHLMEFSVLATRMKDAEDADVVKRTKVKIMDSFWFCVKRIMKPDEIQHLMTIGSVNYDGEREPAIIDDFARVFSQDEGRRLRSDDRIV